MGRSLSRDAGCVLLLAVSWVAFSTWGVAALCLRTRPPSEAAAALPWRVVCMCTAYCKCLPCVALVLSRRRFRRVVNVRSSCASLARGRVAPSVHNAKATLVGAAGSWRGGAVYCQVLQGMVQSTFGELLKTGGRRPHGEGFWFQSRLPLRSMFEDARGPLVKHCARSKSCGLGQI